MELIQSACFTFNQRPPQQTRTISSAQRACHECGATDHLAKNCPVRLCRPRSFCRRCNRYVHHTTAEHRDNRRGQQSSSGLYEISDGGRVTQHQFQNQSDSHVNVPVSESLTDNGNDVFYRSHTLTHTHLSRSTLRYRNRWRKKRNIHNT